LRQIFTVFAPEILQSFQIRVDEVWTEKIESGGKSFISCLRILAAELTDREPVARESVYH
jgi:hypothetical protein